MKKIEIDVSEISTTESFHSIFKCKLGFPDYYGMNMNAWIDCVEDIAISEGFLVLDLKGMKELKQNNPEIFIAINECSAFVNLRMLEAGDEAILALSYG